MKSSSKKGLAGHIAASRKNEEGKEEDSESFIECIHAFGKNLQTGATCDELQDLFLKFALAQKSLPKDIEIQTIDTFIAVLMAVISINYGHETALTGISIFFKYLKNDKRVFTRFHPTTAVVKQLNIHKYLLTEGEEADGLILDFLCFLLRYYRGIDYTQISKDPRVVQKVRRTEIERTWADIENLARNVENISESSDSYQDTTSKAFEEIFNHVEESRNSQNQNIANCQNEVIILKKETGKAVQLVTELNTTVAKRGDVDKIGEQIKAQDIGNVQRLATLEEALRVEIEKLDNKYGEKLKVMETNMNEYWSKTNLLKKSSVSGEKKVGDLENSFNEYKRILQTLQQNVGYDHDLLAETKKIFLSRMTRMESEIVSGRYNLQKYEDDENISSPSKYGSKSPGMGEEGSTSIFRGGSMQYELLNKQVETLQRRMDGDINPKIFETDSKITRLQTDNGRMNENLRGLNQQIDLLQTEIKHPANTEARIRPVVLPATVGLLEGGRDDLMHSITNVINLHSENMYSEIQVIRQNLKLQKEEQDKMREKMKENFTIHRLGQEQLTHTYEEKLFQLERIVRDMESNLKIYEEKNAFEHDLIKNKEIVAIQTKAGLHDSQIANIDKEITKMKDSNLLEFNRLRENTNKLEIEQNKKVEELDNKINLRINQFTLEYDKKILNTENKINELGIKLEDVIEKKVKNLEEKNSDLEKKLGLAHNEINLLKERAGNIETQIGNIEQDLKQNVDKLREEIKGNVAEITKLKENLEAAKSILERVKEELEGNIKNVRTELESNLEKTKQEIENNIEITNNNLSKVKSDLESLETNFDTLVLTTKKMEEDIRKLEEKTVEQDKRLGELDEKTAKLGERAEIIEGTAREAAKVIDLNKMHIKLTNEDILELKASITEENKQIREEIKEETNKVWNRGKEMTEQEIERIWSFVQEFIDEHAIDQRKIIKSPEKNISDKLNSLDWILRYGEFISFECNTTVVNQFRDVLINPSFTRNIFITTKHSSDVMNTLSKMLQLNIKNGVTTEQKQNMSLYLNIMEGLLINNHNLEIGLNLNVVRLLIQVLFNLTNNYELNKTVNEHKFAIRSLTSCFRTEKAVLLLSDTEGGVNLIVDLISTYRDLELLANSIKILRLCLKSDKYYERIQQSKPSMIINLLSALSSSISSSPEIQEESIAAIRNYTRRLDALEEISEPTSINVLCDIVKEEGAGKIRQYAIAALRNMSRKGSLLTFIKQAGVYQMIAKTGGGPADPLIISGGGGTIGGGAPNL